MEGGQRLGEVGWGQWNEKGRETNSRLHQSHPRLWELTNVPTGPHWPRSQTGLVFALDSTPHAFPSPSPTFGSSAFQAGSEAETGHRAGPACWAGPSGKGQLLAAASRPLGGGPPQMLAPSLRASPHTEPTSIWRTISPIPAPVTSTVVAQPNPKRRVWVSQGKSRRQKSAGITPVISGKTLENGATA